MNIFFRRSLDRIRYIQLIMITGHIALQNSSTFLPFSPDNTIQHGGIIVGLGGAAAHAHRGFNRKAYGYFLRNISRNNADSLVEAINADIFDEAVISRFADGSLSAVLSNPPYICSADMKTLQQEVQYEPRLALFGGEDGLDYYRKMLPLWVKKLSNNGIFAVEIGEEQGLAVEEIFRSVSLSPVTVKDYSGHDRIVFAIKQ